MSIPAQHNSQSWDSDLYQNRHSFVWELSASLVDLLSPQSGERILDLGCGTGQLTAKIAESGAKVIGLDHAPTMLEQARSQYPGIQFDSGDAQSFSYPEPFDAIFSNAVLHWISRPEEVIRCVSQVLKTQGRFVVEFGGRGNVQQIVTALQSTSLSILGRTIHHPWYFPSIAEFSSLLERHDLEVIQASLFERRTPLEGPEGLRNWIKMFGNHWLEQIPEAERDAFFEQVEETARPYLFHDGQWHADYRRLRIVAVKQESLSSPGERLKPHGARGGSDNPGCPGGNHAATVPQSSSPHS